MDKPTRFKQLLCQPGSTLLPVAHDALTAKVAQSLGFEAISTGGFAVAGVNYGLPDVGLIGLSEMLSAIRPVIQATDLPVFADADGGYGNERNVAYTVRQYEDIGVASLFIEDQSHPKRCGHMSGKELVSPGEMAAKIKAAVNSRTHPDLTICARTDAVAVENYQSALDRAKLYIQAGADIIFIEAPENIDQLKDIPRQITQVPLLVNMLEGGKTPLLPQKDLQEMGYKLIAYPVTTLFSSLRAIRQALEDLKKYGQTNYNPANMISFDEYKQLVNLQNYI